MYTFIVNPAAGNGYALKTEKRIRDALRGMDIEYEILHTACPEDATHLAAEAAAKHDCTCVIAVGGDGTAYEVACGLMNTGVPLGIIPAGTGNDFIKTVNIPKKPMQALKKILHGTPRPVDVGRLNQRMFLNVCGTGFDVQTLEYTLAAKKYVRGILPYLIGLIRAIFSYKPVHVSFTVDEETQERDVLLCSVANGQFFGGGIPVCPDAKPDDGLLDMIIVETKPRWKIPFYLPGLMMGRIDRFKITTHKRCREMTVISKGMKLNVDGEILTMDEARFEIMPGKLMLYW
ncbi:MAG: diacylglycerol kinase family lipid kinase [Clostridiales bacterium]|nr:diacylglycerol kinase family lipid kinase [Clostridiales bacterium]